MNADRPNPRNVPLLSYVVIEHDDYDCWCGGWHSLTEASRLNAALSPPSRSDRLWSWLKRRVVPESSVEPEVDPK